MIPASVRIFVCTTPQDMRRSFDGLALTVQERLGQDPHSGALFVFINKRANRLKALWFDRNGYCILYKRLHQAVFVPPPSTDRDRPVAQIDAQELKRIFAGVDQPQRIRIKWHSTT
jgi:transposase